MWFEQILNPFEDTNYMSSTVFENVRVEDVFTFNMVGS